MRLDLVTSAVVALAISAATAFSPAFATSGERPIKLGDDSLKAPKSCNPPIKRLKNGTTCTCLIENGKEKLVACMPPHKPGGPVTK